MTQPFQVEVEAALGRTVLTLHGELDLVSSHALEARLRGLDDRASIVIDLRALEFIDSTGLGVLVKTHQRFRESGRELILVAGDGQVSRLLSLTGLADQLTLASDVNEAVGEDTPGAP